jgi:hypothetical protein
MPSQVSAASKNRNPAQEDQLHVSERGTAKTKTPEEGVCDKLYNDINRDTSVQFLLFPNTKITITMLVEMV